MSQKKSKCNSCIYKTHKQIPALVWCSECEKRDYNRYKEMPEIKAIKHFCKKQCMNGAGKWDFEKGCKGCKLRKYKNL